MTKGDNNPVPRKWQRVIKRGMGHVFIHSSGESIRINSHERERTDIIRCVCVCMCELSGLIVKIIKIHHS